MLRALPLLTAAAALAALGCGGSGSKAGIEPKDEIVVAAAGDIACDPDEDEFNDGQGTATECRQRATASLIREIVPDAVLALGDNQYSNGTEFEAAYDPTWGSFKAITYPVAGNHEYQSKGAADYYAYFGKRAGKPDEGWYSFDLASWHLIALNANCPPVGGCDSSSPQARWLRADLEKHSARCTLAFWHQPRFSSGWHGDAESVADLWEILHSARVDVVLNGHDHDYERFAPQDPSGRRDPNGIQEFVVGTGGKSLRGFEEIKPTSVKRTSSAYGVLRMTLETGAYAWRFVPVPGATFADEGRRECH